jgi:4-hydroxybenzoate polyprenyltransferase
MSAWSAIGKVAGVVAFPVVFGGCCGGGGAFLLGSGAMSALGTWLGGGGLVAAVGVGLVVAYAIRQVIRRRTRCSVETELESS